VKKIVSLILSFAILMGTFGNVAFASSEISIMLNDTPIELDVAPIIEDGRTLVPLRAILEALGANVDWNDQTQTATAELDETTIQLTIDSTRTYVNDYPVELDVAARTVDGRTFVPLRFVAENFGFYVGWDAERRVVAINVDAPVGDVRYIDIIDGLHGRNYLNFYRAMPFIDHNDAAMFPLLYFDLLFREGLNYEVYGDMLIITRNVLDVTTTVSLTIGSNIIARNGYEIEMGTTPVRKNGTIYFPLDWVGRAMGYNIIRDDRFGFDRIRVEQFRAMSIYAWNEYQDSSDEGLRFAYVLSGQDIIYISEIKANYTTDFEEVLAVFEQLPPEARAELVVLFPVRGYRVSQEIFDEIAARIFGPGSSWGWWMPYEVSPIVVGLEYWENRDYSTLLYMLNEEAIYNSLEQIYRFFYLSNNHVDFFTLRVEINDDGSANIFYKRGYGDLNPFSDIEMPRNEQAHLSIIQTQELLELLEYTDFWNLPSECFSTEYIYGQRFFEGTNNGEHHIVSRFVFEQNDPIGMIEIFLRNLVEEKFGG